jgi:TnpA family transposase
MPRSFLPASLRRAYSEFPKEIDDYALARYFTLTPRDRELIAHSRGEHNRLGLACQIGWLRWLGWQPESSTGAPPTATAFLAQQLNLSPNLFARYSEHSRTGWEHTVLARQHLNWREYHSAEAEALADALFQEALQYDHARGLFEAAVSFLRREQIIRPGLTTLERAVTAARARAEAHMVKAVEGLLRAEQKQALNALIAPPASSETSALQFLKAPPGQATVRNLLTLLDKIDQVRALGIESLNLSALHPNRRKALAREAEHLYPVHLRRLAAPRRYTLLVCLLDELLTAFNDQAIETYEQVLGEMRNRSQGRRKKELFQRRQLIHTHIEWLRQIGQTVLNEKIPDRQLREAIFKIVSRKTLLQAVKDCETLTQTAEENHLTDLLGSYPHIRRFSPRFLATLKLQATERGQGLFKGVEYLRRLESGEQTEFTDPPLGFISPSQRKIVKDENEQTDRRLWELALHDQLVRAFRSGDIWVDHSADHAPLSHDLRVSAEKKAKFLERNPHLKDANAFLKNQRELHRETLRQANTVWPNLDDVRFEKGRLVLSPLEAEEEPEGTDALRHALYARLPRRKLAQVFREVLHWVDYLQPLREAVGDDVRLDVARLDERLLAVIMAEGCNVGLDNLAEATPGLTYMRLAYIAGRCLDAEALEKAIARVIQRYDHLPITRLWGEGVWSSADGQLVPVPVKSLHARLHPRAPKGKRVVNFFTYIYDRFMPYWGKVIETTAHESAYAIDGLLHNESGLRPTRQATDAAGYTDAVFGLSTLLSIFFAPRLKDLDDQRFFYCDPADVTDFAHLGSLLVAPLDLELVKAHWDELITLAAAIEQGLVPAARVLRKLTAAGHHDLARALQQLGRLNKTIYGVRYLTEKSLRREVERQLNKTETYNSLADVIAWGHKGEMRLAKLQDQLNRASCLRLVAAIIILFNAAYLQAAMKQLQSTGEAFDEKFLAHIYPTQSGHIRFLGDYSFQDEPSLATQIDNLPLSEGSVNSMEMETLEPV